MMKIKELEQAAENFETPFYVYDKEQFTERFQKTCQLLNKDDKEQNDEGLVGLTYSMKANPFMVRTASKMAERIEVCSYGEFEICRTLKIPAGKLLISGVLKKKKELFDMVKYGKEEALYTAESLSQIELLNQAGGACHSILPVLIRLSSGNQFGMDEETILKLIRAHKDYSNIHFIGLHFFSGTKKKNLKKTEKELKKLDEFCGRLLAEEHFQVQMIEYGTGFSVPYFEGEKETVTSSFMEDFRGLVSKMHYRGKLTVEMGRALAYDCGYYFTKVMDRKKNEKTDYCIVDGGIHQINYDGQMRGMYRPLVDILKAKEADAKTEALNNSAAMHSQCMICGSLCTVHDVLIADFKGEIPENGDILVFRNAGAYSLNEGMSTFLSHELPAVYLYGKEEGFRTARRELPGWKLNLDDSSI